MDLLTYINSELNKFLKSDEGKTAIKEAIRDGSLKSATKETSDEAIKVLKECICNFAPPAFSSSETLATISEMIDGSVSTPIDTEDGWEISVEFNGEKLKRPSLWGNSKGVYDIIGLFTQGYEIPETKKLPTGIWHGNKIAALRARPGRPFVEEAVNFFMATYAPKYGVTSIDINPLYGQWGI